MLQTKAGTLFFSQQPGYQNPIKWEPGFLGYPTCSCRGWVVNMLFEILGTRPEKPKTRLSDMMPHP